MLWSTPAERDVLRVVTWNVLAQDYVFPDRYPGSGRFLFAGWRLGAVTATIEALLADADVVLLQEVTDEIAGRVARFADVCYQRRPHHPDGVAVVTRTGGSSAADRGLFVPPEPGRRVWASAIVRHDGHDIRVVSVHLDWDHPDAAPHRGVVQAEELGALCGRWGGPLIVAGDINAGHDSPVAQQLRAGGLCPTGKAGVPTAVVDGRPVELDMIAVRGLSAAAAIVPPVALTMPNATCPSDHVPVGADIRVRSPQPAALTPIQ